MSRQWRRTLTWASFGEKVKETNVVPLWFDIQCVTLKSIQIYFLWCSRGTNKSRGRYEWLHKKVCESLKAPYFCISFVDLCLFFLNSHLNTNTISIFIIKYCKYGFFLFRHCIRWCPHRIVGVSSGIIMIFVHNGDNTRLRLERYYHVKSKHTGKKNDKKVKLIEYSRHVGWVSVVYRGWMAYYHIKMAKIQIKSDNVNWNGISLMDVLSFCSLSKKS